MPIIDLVLPKMGESIVDATILRWNKQVGEEVEEEEPILEIATDKVDSEVPSPVKGKIVEILFQENEVVPVGETIAKIEYSGDLESDEDDDLSALLEDDEEEPEVQEEEEKKEENGDNKQAEGKDQKEEKKEISRVPQDNSHFYSPLVLKIAAEENIPLSDLEKIKGSGLGGRVRKDDVLKYLEERTSGKIQKEEKPVEKEKEAVAPKSSPKVSAKSSNVEIIEMDRMRKMVAEHMVMSKKISPHATSFSEADVTNMVKWRNKVKDEFLEREGEKLTFTPLFIEAIARCIKRFPRINCSVDGDQILIKKDINVGMAAALPDGNLIVPVIRNADQFNLVGLARQVNELARKARNKKLDPDATRDGTFTFTNVGGFNSLIGIPIINQPQVAILAVGTIKKRPVVVEGPDGDSIAIRHMMYLSMSYDHRVVDGSLGSTFLAAVAEELENFDANRKI